MSHHPEIFLSYAWHNFAIADEIDDFFRQLGINLRQDIRDLVYRSSIKEFMREVGKTNYVLMIISQEYLCSENCMYEMIEVLNTHEFEQRILPIVLENASHPDSLFSIK